MQWVLSKQWSWGIEMVGQVAEILIPCTIIPLDLLEYGTWRSPIFPSAYRRQSLKPFTSAASLLPILCTRRSS